MVHGYISDKTSIVSTTRIGNDGFLIDDPTIYTLLISKIKSISSISTPSDVLNIIQETINEYFGGLSLEGDEENRTKLIQTFFNKYADDDYMHYQSISDYRNNHTALCTERSAIAQNLISFLGGDAYFMMGHLSRNNGISNLNHAFTIIKDSEFGSGMIIDFTNPVLSNDNDLQYVYHSSIIAEKYLDDFLTGKENIQINRPEFCKQKDYSVRRIHTCSYSLNALNRSQINELNSIPITEEILDSKITFQEIGKKVTKKFTQNINSAEQVIQLVDDEIQNKSKEMNENIQGVK